MRQHGSLQRPDHGPSREQCPALGVLFLATGSLVLLVVVLVTLPFINPIGQSSPVAQLHHIVGGLVGLVAPRVLGAILVDGGTVHRLEVALRGIPVFIGAASTVGRHLKDRLPQRAVRVSSKFHLTSVVQGHVLKVEEVGFAQVLACVGLLQQRYPTPHQLVLSLGCPDASTLALALFHAHARLELLAQVLFLLETHNLSGRVHLAHLNVLSLIVCVIFLHVIAAHEELVNLVVVVHVYLLARRVLVVVRGPGYRRSGGQRRLRW